MGPATLRGRARWALCGALCLGGSLLCLAGPSGAEDAPPPAAAPGEAEAGRDASPDSAAGPAPSSPPGDEPRPAQLAEPANVETPVFSSEEVRYLDAVRLRLESELVPSSDFSGTGIALYRPNARLRVAVPISRKAVVQLSGRFETSLYEPSPQLPLGPQAERASHLFAFETDLQGALQLNDSRFLFVEGEKWALLGDVFVASRWEEGVFSEAITWGGGLAPGYEIPRFRVALGVRLQTKLGRSGVRVSPVATLRWIPTDRITLRNRGLGLQLEYRVSDSLELFVAGYTDTRRYLLRERLGAAGPETLRDEQVLVGAGFEWRLGKHLRFNLEGGAVARRELAIELDDHTSWRQHARPAGYCDLRVEVRP